MKFTVEKKTWLRGEGCSESYLLREDDGKRCCLGFYGQALGIDDADLISAPAPSDMADQYKTWGELLRPAPYKSCGYEPSIVCTELMIANDDEDMSDNEREKHIEELFGRIGVEVEFK